MIRSLLLTTALSLTLPIDARTQETDEILAFAKTNALPIKVGSEVENQGKKYVASNVSEPQIFLLKVSRIKAALGENNYFADKLEFLITHHIQCDPVEITENPIEFCIAMKVNCMAIKNPETDKNVLGHNIIYSNGLAGVTLVGDKNCVCSKYKNFNLKPRHEYLEAIN